MKEEKKIVNNWQPKVSHVNENIFKFYSSSLKFILHCLVYISIKNESNSDILKLITIKESKDVIAEKKEKIIEN